MLRLNHTNSLFYMDKKLVVLEYQDNFADNLSTYAYGKIAKNKFDVQTYWKNNTSLRYEFEDMMKDFKLEHSYISNSRANELSKRNEYMDYRDFCAKSLKSDKIISLKNFKIDDIKFVTDEIKNDFSFNNLDFISNYDILETIKSTNSIGLYINKNDKPDKKYIEKALNRLNKYLKQPKLYVFYSDEITLNSPVEYEMLNLYDWREEFYFLKNCRNKIIHCSENSYSEGIWASILSDSEFGYTVFDKKIHTQNKLERWLSV